MDEDKVWKNCIMMNKYPEHVIMYAKLGHTYMFHEPVIVLHLHQPNKATSETKTFKWWYAYNVNQQIKQLSYLFLM